MVKQLTAERRKALRARRILSIQYRLVKSRYKEGDIQWHLSTTHDMSILGLAFLSDVPYAIDDVLEIQVVMSGILDIYKGYGKVVRVERKATGAFYLIAVKFVDSRAAARRKRRLAASFSRTNRIRKAVRRK
jgi:hypothetical protein